MMESLRAKLATQVFRSWPTYIGLHRLPRVLGVPTPPREFVTRELSGFPLKLKFRADTYMGQFLFHRGMYEEGVVDKLRSLLKPGMTFVDVGANAGLYAVIGAHLVGDSGRVIAFEPQEDLAELVRENTRLNHLENVHVETCALGAREGQATLFQVSRSNDGQATTRVRPSERCFGDTVNVRLTRLTSALSSLGVDVVDGLKIDTEGAELEVLKGFLDGWTGERPRFILFECIAEHLTRFGQTTEELIQFLRCREYELRCLFRGRWHLVRTANDHVRCRHSSDMLALDLRRTRREQKTTEQRRDWQREMAE